MSKVSPELIARAARIRLVLLDVDGVLTDGGIYMTADGEEARCFHVRDGHGIRMGQHGGLQFGLISGRKSTVVARRAAELDIAEVHQGILGKLACFEEILGRLQVSAAEVCFVGDDLIDVPVLRRAGLAAAPADAAPEARRAAHLVTERDGGRGAVREVIDLVLRATDQWTSVTARYLE